MELVASKPNIPKVLTEIYEISRKVDSEVRKGVGEKTLDALILTFNAIENYLKTETLIRATPIPKNLIQPFLLRKGITASSSLSTIRKKTGFEESAELTWKTNKGFRKKKVVTLKAEGICVSDKDEVVRQKRFYVRSLIFDFSLSENGQGQIDHFRLDRFY